MEPATIESGNAISLLRTLDIKLKEIGERHAVMEVVVAEKHANYLGGAHGGLMATLIDSVCFFPRSLLPSGRMVTTTNLNLSYIRAARVGDRLSARAELVHLGRKTASLTASVTDSTGRLIAHGTVTLMVLSELQEDRAVATSFDCTAASAVEEN